MFNRLLAQNGIFRLPLIQRKDEDELNIAIANLENRGFRLARRGTRYNEMFLAFTTWAIME